MQSTITFFTVVLCIVCGTVYAQSYNVSGTTKDNAGKPIAGVTVLLLKATDSSVVQYALSEESGRFIINEAKTGKYLVHTQAIGYEKSYRELELSGHITLDITLQPDSKQLQEVTVTGKKPYIEKGLGKTIINLDQANTSAGSNVLELLRKMPGVVVDASGNISLKGEGVMVMIDDKPTYLEGDQLATYLRGISAEQVAKLELIDQPSAKYDAEGSGGIVNIKMKRLKKGGLNGNINLSTQYATFINTDNSANINYRKNKVNLYANTGYVHYTGYLDVQSSKQVKDAQTGNVMNTSELDGYMQETPINLNLQTGIDYSINDKLTVGGNIKGIYNPLTERGITTMIINDIPSNTTIHNESHTGYDVKRYHLNGNAYANYDITEKSNLSIDADYIYRDMQQQHYLNSYNYNAQMQPLQDSLLLRLNFPTSAKIYVARADYRMELKNKWQLETGVKTNIANIRATSDYQINTANGWQYDSTRSNDLIYNENINAAYVSGSKVFGEKWQTQLGLRAEQTIIAGEQLADGQTFGFNMTSLFPTAIVYYKVNENHVVSLNFNKRVQRPFYRELNPFITFISQYAYTSGNPKLQPQYRYALDADYSYKNMLSTSVGYRIITNDRNPELFFDAVRNATWLTTANNATRYVFHASESISKQLFNWWYMQAQADMYLVSYKRSDGALLFVKGVSGEIGVSNQFSLGKGWSLDSTIAYTTGGLQSMIETNGQTLWIGFNASKKIWKDAATIKLSVSDPMNVYAYTPESNWNNIHSTSVMKNASQQISIGFAYNFGKHDDSGNKKERQQDDSGRM